MAVKGNFFTLDALLGSMILVGALILVGHMFIEKDYVEDIDRLSYDAVTTLSLLKVGELSHPYVDSLKAAGEITVYDLNTSILDMIGIFWAEGKPDIARDLARAALSGIIPSEYSYSMWADDTMIDMVNASSQENLIQYSKFVTGIEEGEVIRGYLSKVYFSGINSKRTNAFMFFGGYVGDGNITQSIKLPSNSTVISAVLEVEAGNDFELFINGFDEGTFVKGSAGGGYMESDRWDLLGALAHFQGGNNTIEIRFNQVGNNYIGGGYLQVTYDTPFKSEIENEYYGDSVIRVFQLPGIEGIINLYDSIYVPGFLDQIEIYLNYYSNYSSFFTVGGVEVYASAVPGNHSVVLNNTYLSQIFLAAGLTYSDLSNSTLPIRFGLDDVDYTGITGATDSIVVTDVSESMRWYSTPIKPVITSNISSSSYIKIDEFTVGNPSTDSFTLDSDADWGSGSTTNITISGGSISLEQNGPEIMMLDQSQLSTDSTRTFYRLQMRGQTFTAGISGDLEAVTLQIYKRGAAPALVVEIRNATGGLPTSNVLASTSRNDLTTGVTDDYNFTFSSPAELTAGREYAIVAYVCCGGTGGAANANYRISRVAGAGAYSGGQYIYSDDFASSWSGEAADTYFMTYISADGYASKGTAEYEFDAGDVVKWLDFSSTETEPSGTSITWEFSASNDSSSWTGWYSDITLVPHSRYITQRASLTSTGGATPVIDETTILATDELDTDFYNSFDVVMEFRSETYTANTARLRLKSPTGIWYGDGLGGASTMMEANYDRSIYLRILEGGYEEGVWEVHAKITSGKETNYTLVEQYPPERIEVAELADTLFVDTILRNIENRIGLSAYAKNVESYDALTNQSAILLNRIESYNESLDSGTCICCGINRAVNLLPNNGTRFIVVMSDGDANYVCSDFNDYTGSRDYDLGPVSAVLSGQNACSQDIRVFSIGFGASLTEVGTDTMKQIACNESDYFNAQNASSLLEIFDIIAQEILSISYLKQSVNVTGNISMTYLYPQSYIKVNYSGVSDPADYGEIVIYYEGAPFNNTGSNGTLYIPAKARLLEANVASFSGNEWTSNVTVRPINSSIEKDVFMLSSYGNQFTELGDPFIVNIPVSDIARDINNSIRVRTGITPVNISGGSVDDRIFYKIVIQNFADSPQVGSVAVGCEWILEFDDGTTSSIKIPASYSGSDLCYYKNQSYNTNDSVNMAAYSLFSQLDLKGNGTLTVKIDEDNLVAELSTVSNVPSLLGPTVMRFKVWK